MTPICMGATKNACAILIKLSENTYFIIKTRFWKFDNNWITKSINFEPFSIDLSSNFSTFEGRDCTLNSNFFKNQKTFSYFVREDSEKPNSNKQKCSLTLHEMHAWPFLAYYEMAKAYAIPTLENFHWIFTLSFFLRRI